MRVLWIGESMLDAALPENGLSARHTHIGPRMAGVGRVLREQSPVDGFNACLVTLDGDIPRMERLLRHLHRQCPQIPVGLIACNDEKAAALGLLRRRYVDRVIPLDHARQDLSRDLEALYAHGALLKTLRNTFRRLAGRHVFVTGGTGFLGGHFLHYVLRCTKVNVIALTRAHSGVPYNKRLSWLEELHPGRIEYVEGDVTHPGLGLSPQHLANVTDLTEEIWHLAAITKFEEILREAIFNVNLTGTENLIAFARQLPNLRRIHHVSTAYVAGDHDTAVPVPEAPLLEPPSFKNPYEESKFLAEQKLAASGLPVLVYRPSIIMGERVSGLCDGQTVYNVAKMLRMARLSGERAAIRNGDVSEPGSFRVVVDPATHKNLIPVDDVVRQLFQIAASDAAPGDHFHLTHPIPTPMTDIIAVIAGLLNIPEYEAVQTLDGRQLSTSESVLQRISGVFRPYMLNTDPLFETHLTRRATNGVPPRPLDRDQLRFLIQSFFEQHFDWDFQPAPVAACL